MNEDDVDNNIIVMMIIIFTIKDCSLDCIEWIDFKSTLSCQLPNVCMQIKGVVLVLTGAECGILLVNRFLSEKYSWKTWY